MKILVIGLGSIGKRHLRNLLSLNYTDISVVTGKAIPDEFDGLPTFKNVGKALEQKKYHAAFICLPTSLHLNCLRQLLGRRVENIYVEKPLSHNTENIAEILSLASCYKNNVKVGYDLHFDPGIQKIRELLHQNLIGKIVSVNAFVGQYLPHWRPYEDHRRGMSALKETGGGVLLDIVHEFDYLCWLAGDVESVACWHTNSGCLEIETEEAADVLLKFANGVIGTVHLDYLQPVLTRHCTFTGTKGSIIADLAKSQVQWMLHDGTKCEFNYAGFERDDRFKEILRAFMENSLDERLTSLTDSLQSLLIVEAAKRSSANDSIVKIKNITLG